MYCENLQRESTIVIKITGEIRVLNGFGSYSFMFSLNKKQHKVLIDNILCLQAFCDNITPIIKKKMVQNDKTQEKEVKDDEFVLFTRFDKYFDITKIKELKADGNYHPISCNGFDGIPIRVLLAQYSLVFPRFGNKTFDGWRRK